MPAQSVHIVLLRRPVRANANERRTDPFYEFGSFGLTGCHSRNLLNPGKIDRIAGTRLAFAQGGPSGFRLVYLTPPTFPRLRAGRVEAAWLPVEQAFRYNSAPILASNHISGDFPLLEKLATGTSRTTAEGGFSSLFRSRTKPLDPQIALELVRVYESYRQHAPQKAFAECYSDALPYKPSIVDDDRASTYRRLCGEAKPRRRC